MHSRVGLATEYLSDEWFQLVGACIDEAKKNDMEAWLYDEDRWPSGAAGGLVTQNPEYQRRELRLSVIAPDSLDLDGTEIAVFFAKIEDGLARDLRRAEPGFDQNDGEESALLFKVVREDPSPWYNGQTYLDTLSPCAVQEFIHKTHERYANREGNELGSGVPGIFTDEPNYGRLRFDGSSGSVPWTDSLLEVFQDRHGYDLVEHLPSLFFRVDGKEFSKVRLDYFETITHLFTSSFAKQVGDWCENHDLLFTGHVLSEENLLSQTAVVGSAMRFYEHMQAPGIDILRGQGLEREGGMEPEITTAKQCSSVKNQFGRKWMLSELYGCTGWHFNFAEHKAVGDWQAALGVNLRCQHLSWYTMKGQAKRDYPASISFQSPWWREYNLVEDYFSRINVLTTQGRAIRDIAVLHPIESAWGLYSAADRESDELLELNRDLENLENLLLRNHYDFDFVDEEILSRHGRIDDGKLVIGQARYRIIIVPPTWTLRSSTIALLNSALGSGCDVVFISNHDSRVDGIESDELDGIYEENMPIPLEEKRLLDILDASGSRGISIIDSDGNEYPHCLYMWREDEEGRNYLFICHTKQSTKSGPLEVKIPVTGQVQEWEPSTGDVFKLDSDSADGRVVFNTDLDAYGSRAFVVDPDGKPDLRERKNLTESRRIDIDPLTWKILRDEPNAITLDMGRYCIDGGSWKGPLEILKMDAAIRNSIGLQRRGGRMVQPWARKEKDDLEKVEVSIRFRFNAEKIPSGPCHLVLEQPERFQIELNGKRLERDEGEGWWIDPSLKRIRVPPGQLKKGGNTILMTTEYSQDHGLETVYLTGEFGARLEEVEPVIYEVPKELGLGDWTDSGFPSYSGSITYSTSIEAPDVDEEERVFLEVPEWEGVLFKVRVNGNEVGRVGWPPYELEVTPALEPGENPLEIEIISSRRNLLGPLHLTEKYPKWTGPSKFETEGDEWTDGYVRIPCGLMGPPVLSIRTEEEP